MSNAQPTSKRKRRTKEEVRRDLTGNYMESSSYVDSVQKSMTRAAEDDAHVLEHWEHSTTRQDSAQASSSFFSELTIPMESQDNSRNEDPFNVFETATSMDNLETDQTHESSLLPNVESTISSSPEENSSDYSEIAWLHDYLAKIQDALHEELTHVEQEFNAEEETNGDALDMSMPDFACFTQDKKEDEENLDERALYPGAAITVGLSALLIMTFALRHMLSGEALSDMLTLISAHCLSPNLCMKSIFELKKHFHNLKAPMKFHRYCSHCFLQVEGNLNVCPNSFCSRDLTQSENSSFFIEIPIASQIRDFFARPGFLQLLEHRFTRVKKDPDNI